MRGNSAKDFETVVHSFKKFLTIKERKSKQSQRHELSFSNTHHIKRKSYKALGHPLLPAVSQIAFLETGVKHVFRTADSEKERGSAAEHN